MRDLIIISRLGLRVESQWDSQSFLCLFFFKEINNCFHFMRISDGTLSINLQYFLDSYEENIALGLRPTSVSFWKMRKLPGQRQ